jgi:HAD superfamily hydrolase (TIGR01509 family)
VDLSDCQHWVFDLDGTLTVAVHDFDAIRAELDLPADRPILEEVARLPDGERARVRERLDRIELDLARAARPALGLSALLDGLAQRGARTGILTRNSAANAWITLQAIGAADHFDRADILGRDEAPPKPEPAGLELLLERWAVCPERVVMVGDYHFDLAAGRAAGVRTAHVDVAGVFSWPELTDVRATRLDQLLPGLEGGKSSPTAC